MVTSDTLLDEGEPWSLQASSEVANAPARPLESAERSPVQQECVEEMANRANRHNADGKEDEATLLNAKDGHSVPPPREVVDEDPGSNMPSVEIPEHVVAVYDSSHDEQN